MTAKKTRKKPAKGKGHKHYSKTEGFILAFVEAYFEKNRNATRAYMAARAAVGVTDSDLTPAAAAVNASKLLRIAKVSDLIKAKETAIQQRFELSADRVREEWSRVAFFDIGELFTDEGYIKMPADWSPEVRKALVGMDVEGLFAGKGEEREQIGNIRKIRAGDKVAVLRDIAKHLGMFEKDNKQKTDPIRELLAAIDGKSLDLVNPTAD